jgi:hypothetical protein
MIWFLVNPKVELSELPKCLDSLRIQAEFEIAGQAGEGIAQE